MKKIIFTLLLIILLNSGCTSDDTYYNCTEPKNIYIEGSEYYEGYEFGVNLNESGGDMIVCGGNTMNFFEGCKEYVNQLIEYEVCLSKKELKK